MQISFILQAELIFNLAKQPLKEIKIKAQTEDI